MRSLILFFDWLVRPICVYCHKSTSQRGSELCTACVAALERGLRELLKDK